MCSGRSAAVQGKQPGAARLSVCHKPTVRVPQARSFLQEWEQPGARFCMAACAVLAIFCAQRQESPKIYFSEEARLGR